MRRFDIVDWIGVSAFAILCGCTGALLSFRFITELGWVEDRFRYHIWVSYVSKGPEMLAVCAFLSFFMLCIYGISLWLENRHTEGRER